MIRFRLLQGFLLIAPILVVSTGCAKSGEEAPASDTQNSGTDSGADPKSYFFSTVIPQLQKTTACGTCHALPKDGGDGNMKPYDYSTMRNLLVTGPVNLTRTTVDNGVMRYMLGQISTHAGGRVFCFGNLTGSPCAEIREWAKQEGLTVASADSTGGINPAPFGRATGGGVDGRIAGWAADPDTPSTPMTVEFYAGGPHGTGTLIGSVVANANFYSSEKKGNVGYQFVLPDAYRDGTSQTIYVYGLDNNTPGLYHELTGSPIVGTSYVPDAAAQTYYEGTVLPYIQSKSCTNCHSIGEFQYSYAFYAYLLSPPPLQGGTATNNIFFNKMFGSQSHRGGAFCGGNAGNAPCSYLVNTWNMEFH